MKHTLEHALVLALLAAACGDAPKAPEVAKPTPGSPAVPAPKAPPADETPTPLPTPPAKPEPAPDPADPLAAHRGDLPFVRGSAAAAARAKAEGKKLFVFYTQPG